MLRGRILALGVCVLLGCAALFGQHPPWTLTAGVRGSYTTSSKLFPTPDAASPSVRATSTLYEHIYGCGIEVRLKPPHEGYFVALVADYLLQREHRTQIVRSALGTISVPATEGFEAVPVELSGNIYIPLGSRTVRLLMGGGAGVTVLRRILSVGGIAASSQRTSLSVGIHVRTAVEYRLERGISLVGELRLRDPEAETVNRFEAVAGEYSGVRFELPSSDIRGRVNLDGMNFSLGLMVEIL